MPQLDNLTYLPQVFWVCVFFSLWYAISSLAVLPALLQQLNTRYLLLELSEKRGDEASAGLTEVHDRITSTLVGGGESERAERTVAIDSSSSSLETSKLLASSV